MRYLTEYTNGEPTLDDEAIKLFELYEQARRVYARCEQTPPSSPWIEGVTLDRIYPQDCFNRAYTYTRDSSRSYEKHLLVHGETSLALGGHAWVELPNGLVFDGVFQRFYRIEDYYGEMAHAKPWYFYEPKAAVTLGSHLQASVGIWWARLGLPMILNRPPIHIDEKRAWELLVNYYSQFDEARLRGVQRCVLRQVAEFLGVVGAMRMKKNDLITAIFNSPKIVLNHAADCPDCGVEIWASASQWLRY
jgi:hypothetical protein